MAATRKRRRATPEDLERLRELRRRFGLGEFASTRGLRRRPRPKPRARRAASAPRARTKAPVQKRGPGRVTTPTPIVGPGAGP